MTVLKALMAHKASKELQVLKALQVLKVHLALTEHRAQQVQD
jgi:hypothetical protein